MCLTANVPLIESGTAGFAGQVQPIIPVCTRCPARLSLWFLERSALIRTPLALPARALDQGRTTCYDCKARPVPKTFPVCTIRATPSTPIHCIVWAKSYLFVCVRSSISLGLGGLSAQTRARVLTAASPFRPGSQAALRRGRRDDGPGRA